MKRLLFAVLLSFIFVVNGYASEKYSTISTNFEITKMVKCDRLIAGFRVCAQANTFSEALNRLKPVNNEFLNFLYSLLPKSDIKTRDAYSSSNGAALIVMVDTKKILVLPKILNYISTKKFPYKVGVEVLYISYGISDETQNKVKSEIFKDALQRSKYLLNIINNEMGRKYYLGNLYVNYSFGPIMLRNSNFERLMAKSNTAVESTPIETSSGSKLIKVNVRFQAVAPIK
ncbi:hypothetical protein [Hippea maritima]|uniref:SIMPL domain-containing protein n=1 Tax=Hippea maritima (strain ATCC 700847 / DSM 10411 / MH2) TaxID=760142 RepID=F2LV07_HIPMA|nr:hypothetical protein [Hippea maritima]AEA33591.1 hypothetical protein Hipma_0621 [Hippea maritima DSM 10411]